MRCNNGIPAGGMGAKTVAFSMVCENRKLKYVTRKSRKRHIMTFLIQPRMPCQKPSGSVIRAPVMAR